MRGRAIAGVWGGAIGVVVLGLLAANVSGALPIPVGPLGARAPDGPDLARTTVDHSTGIAAIYLAPFVENAGPLPVTVVAVTPRGVTVEGSVNVLGSLEFDRDDPAERRADGVDAIVLGIEMDPGVAWASPDPVTGVTVDPRMATASSAGRAFLVRVTPDPTQVTAVMTFDVEYAIGPLRFVATAASSLGSTIVVCPADRPHPAPDTGGECVGP